MVEMSPAWTAIEEQPMSRPDPHTRKARRGIIVRVEKKWPRAVILACQFGLLAGILAFWEVGAQARWIDPFFWSQPTAIWASGVGFVSRWSSLYDTWFTVSS